MFARTPCPDSPSLRQLLLGRLPFPDGEPLYEHLDECDRCAEYARTFRADDWLSAAVRGADAVGAENASVLCLIDALNRAGPPAPDERPDAPPPRGAAADAGGELFDFLAPAREPDELGRLGDYRILKVLGSGGMGVVFHAEDPALRRAVAVKAMRPGLAASASARRRFLREGRAAAALHHDHIVPIFQVGEDRGVPYLAMPLLHGETLEDRLRREAALPVAEVFRIGREISLGLAAAHAKGLIHRDIKPANIWLESDEPDREGIRMQGTTSLVVPAPSTYGRVKILDFGLARPTTDAKLTQEGAIVGTPAFMAPEQAKGAAVDARSDLFSLGCVLYRMAAGAAPFPGDDAVAVLLAVARDQPRPPAEVNPTVPPPLSALVMRLLAKDPADRPASAREVIERLTQAEAEAAAPPTRRAGWGLRRWVLLAAALVLGAGAVAAMGVRVTVPTDRGDVTIETDDPNIEVVVTKGGKLVRIVDPQSKQTWELDPQKYELRMADQPDGLAIELDGKVPFVLKRKGEKLVTIARGAGAKAEKVGEASRPSPIRTVRVSAFENQSADPRLEADLRQIVIREIETGTNLKVVAADADADSELTGTIRRAGKSLFNQWGLTVDVAWKDLRTGKPLSGPRGEPWSVRAETSYDPERGESVQSARRRSMEKAADQLITLAETAAAGRFPDSVGVFTPVPVPPGVTERMEEKYGADRDLKTPILPPIRDGFPPPTCKDPPDDSAILRAMPPLMSVPNLYEEYRDNVQIVTEQLVDKIDPPRFFPLVGPAQLHHCHWKCTVYYDETVESNYPFPVTSSKPRVQVVYIDKDHLHLCPGSTKESRPAVGRDPDRP